MRKLKDSKFKIVLIESLKMSGMNLSEYLAEDF